MRMRKKQIWKKSRKRIIMSRSRLREKHIRERRTVRGKERGRNRKKTRKRIVTKRETGRQKDRQSHTGRQRLHEDAS